MEQQGSEKNMIQNKGTDEIGRSIGMNGGAVHWWLKSLGIKTRSKGEGMRRKSMQDKDPGLLSYGVWK